MRKNKLLGKGIHTRMWRRLLGLVVAASCAATAWAHGLMTVPVTRNFESGTYCDHCLNGGGVGAVYATGAWPNGKHGVCGDPASGEGAGYHEGGGKFEQLKGIRVTYYHAGDTIAVKGKLTANHLGYMQYFLCVLPPNSAGGTGERQHLTNDCFRKNVLRVQQDGSWGDRYYVSSSLGEFSHNLKLPDIECPRCVMRWYYLTGNSCTPPGTPAKWAASGLVPCGGGGANPEEFWNCADVTLLKKGEQLPAQTTLKFRGELGTGESTGGGVEPGEQTIEDTETGQVIGDGSNGNGTVSGTGDDDDMLVSFENVMVSVMVGTGVGLPMVLVSPTLGTTAGLCAFVMAIVFFIVRNAQREDYEMYGGVDGHKKCV